MSEIVKMNEMNFGKSDFTTIELTDLINKFRKEEGGRKQLLHKTFLDVIRDEFEEEIREQKILPSSQTVEMPNGGTREQPVFILNLKQSRQVLVRESKFVRKAVIEYIDKLEQSLLQQQRFGGFYIPPDYAGALQLAADFAKENEEQKKTIKEQEAQLVIQAPKVEFANQVESAENSISIGAFAKALQKNGVRIGRNRMMLWFRKNGYLGSQGKEKNKPKQFSINNGYMESELYTVTSKKTGKVNVYDAPRITGKGIVYFTKKYLDSVKSA